MNVFEKQLGDLGGLDTAASLATVASFLSYLQENTDYSFGRLDNELEALRGGIQGVPQLEAAMQTLTETAEAIKERTVITEDALSALGGTVQSLTDAYIALNERVRALEGG